ncbi:ABC transporter ATP-binding protein [Castellaniella sp. WN]
MVLEISRLTFSHPRQATPVLRHIDLRLSAGHSLCLLGVNGTGKTTLLRCVTGLLEPQEGRIVLRDPGGDTLRGRQRARAMAYVPQQTAAPALSLRDLVLLGRTPHLSPLALPGAHDLAMATHALDRVGIAHLAARRFDRISGGQQRLALVARALAQEPSLLVMDEPMAGLDLGNQGRMLALIRSLNEEGLAVLLTTHQPEHAWLLDAQAAVLEHGRLAHCGPARSLLDTQLLGRLYDHPIHISFHEGAPCACTPRMKGASC